MYSCSQSTQSVYTFDALNLPCNYVDYGRIAHSALQHSQSGDKANEDFTPQTRFNRKQTLPTQRFNHKGQRRVCPTHKVQPRVNADSLPTQGSTTRVNADFAPHPRSTHTKKKIREWSARIDQLPTALGGRLLLVR